MGIRRDSPLQTIPITMKIPIVFHPKALYSTPSLSMTPDLWQPLTRKPMKMITFLYPLLSCLNRFLPRLETDHHRPFGRQLLPILSKQPHHLHLPGSQHVWCHLPQFYAIVQSPQLLTIRDGMESSVLPNV
ncbi:hypothetical protein X801_10730 [Opisthorchis viverrini]|uniref:Uncharacterized protein n=1 Tax=Opisthorchis viverrini TaxID=6198 RepID=A0A1S8WGE0_OPIVI|nr:hypothetical protein X801_10730 [Opisthorchis viverrini]